MISSVPSWHGLDRAGPDPGLTGAGRFPLLGIPLQRAAPELMSSSLIQWCPSSKARQSDRVTLMCKIAIHNRSTLSRKFR